jgi:hypothetical protein
VTITYLDKLLASGLTGQDITKLIQLDTDLADVVAALRGGLSAQFVHHMISRKISFVVSTVTCADIMPGRAVMITIPCACTHGGCASLQQLQIAAEAPTRLQSFVLEWLNRW